jgi:hypothetical protein
MRAYATSLSFILILLALSGTLQPVTGVSTTPALEVRPERVIPNGSGRGNRLRGSGQRQLSSETLEKIRKEILIMGDSLLLVPENFFKFSDAFRDSVCSQHTNIDCIISKEFLGGYSVEDMLAIVRRKYEKLKKYKRPFPDAVMIHSNSDTIKDEETAVKYKETLQKLVNLLKAHANYILLVSPGLFSPDGEIEAHWNDHMQGSTLRCIEIQAEICASDPTITCINFRTILQKKIKYFISKGFIARNLKFMVGKKKLWVNETGLIQQTWDYQGSGGILTFDGEHLNERGTKLLVSVVAEQFNNWKGLWGEDVMPSIQPSRRPTVKLTHQPTRKPSQQPSQEPTTSENDDDAKDETDELPKKPHYKKHSSNSKATRPSFPAVSLPTEDKGKGQSEILSIGEVEQLNVLKALWSRDTIQPLKLNDTKDDNKEKDKLEASWKRIKDDQSLKKKHKRHSRHSRHSKTSRPTAAPTYLPIVIDVSSPLFTDSGLLVSENENKKSSWHSKTSRPTAMVTNAPTNLDVTSHLAMDRSRSIPVNNRKGFFGVLTEKFSKWVGLSNNEAQAEMTQKESRDVLKLEKSEDAKDESKDRDKIETYDTIKSKKKHKRKHFRYSGTPSPSASETNSPTNLDIEKLMNEVTEEIHNATKMEAYLIDKKALVSVVSMYRNETISKSSYINTSTTTIPAHFETEKIKDLNLSISVNVNTLRSISKEVEPNLNISLASLAANTSSLSTLNSDNDNVNVTVASPNLQAVNSTSITNFPPVVEARNISVVKTKKELSTSDRIGPNHTLENTTQPLSHLNHSIRIPVHHVNLTTAESPVLEDEMMEMEEVLAYLTSVVSQHSLYLLCILALVFLSARLFLMWFRPFQLCTFGLRGSNDDVQRNR